VSFTVAVERAAPAARARPGSVIGIDLGVKVLNATCGVSRIRRTFSVLGRVRTAGLQGTRARADG